MVGAGVLFDIPSKGVVLKGFFGRDACLGELADVRCLPQRADASPCSPYQ